MNVEKSTNSLCCILLSMHFVATTAFLFDVTSVEDLQQARINVKTFKLQNAYCSVGFGGGVNDEEYK